jgi:hypothetical protein
MGWCCIISLLILVGIVIACILNDISGGTTSTTSTTNATGTSEDTIYEPPDFDPHVDDGEID